MRKGDKLKILSEKWLLSLGVIRACVAKSLVKFQHLITCQTLL
jgi:hypothetical protein